MGQTARLVSLAMSTTAGVGLLLGLMIHVDDCAGPLPSTAIVSDRVGSVPLACTSAPIGRIWLRRAIDGTQVFVLQMKAAVR